MNKIIPLSTPNLSPDIVDNLKECIETGWVSTGGRFIGEFENKIAKYVGVEEAVSMQSGTAGLHIALKVLGIKEDDEVIVPTLTFIAAVNPVTYVGAVPVFMDCDDSLCMDPDKLVLFLDEECEFIGDIKPPLARGDAAKQQGGFLRNKSTGRRVSAIIVVHVFGNLANMERIMEIAEKYNLKVLEDATEALGSYYTDGKYKGKFAGTVGDMGVYSFNANKIITTGGGGMIVSNNQEYLSKAKYLGIQAKDDSLYFVHNEIGYNYRMLNLQAALGVDQIDRLEGFIKTKKANYWLYKNELSTVQGLELIPFKEGTRANHWFYSILVNKDKFGINRDELLEKLNEASIQSRPVWKLIHKQKPYAQCLAYKIEKADYYEERILNLPCTSNLTEDDVRYVCEVIRSVI